MHLSQLKHFNTFIIAAFRLVSHGLHKLTEYTWLLHFLISAQKIRFFKEIVYLLYHNPLQ